MANPSIVALPQPAGLPPATREVLLSVGRELMARVASVADDGALLLKVGSGVVAARSDTPLRAGDVLRLQVAEAGPEQVVLKVLPTPRQAAPPGASAPVRFDLPVADLQPLADELAPALPGEERPQSPGQQAPGARQTAPPAPSVLGRVVEDEQGRLLLRLPSGSRMPLPEQLQRTTALAAGDVVEVTVAPTPPDAETATVELRPLPTPADQRAGLVRVLTSRLAPRLGESTAAGIAAFVAARGVSANETPLLAARVLAQELSPVERLRSLAASHPKAAALLHAIEQDLASGDRDRVRSALSRLGLDQERRLALGDLTSASTVKSLAGPEGETTVGAQQLLLLKPGSEPTAPAFLFLPLPDGAQARLVVEDSAQTESSDNRFVLRGELDLARTGTISFQLLALEQGTFLRVESPDGDVVEHLRSEVEPLRAGLERALGTPVSATVSQSPPEAPPATAVNFAKADLYA